MADEKKAPQAPASAQAKPAKVAKLKIERYVFNNTNVIGRLYFNGVFLCYTLEDREGTPGEYSSKRKNVVIGQGICIPVGGFYKVVLEKSGHLNRILPSIYGIPSLPGGEDFNKQYEATRMHGGNKATDTLGCVCVGMEKRSDFEIGQSAETALVTRLRDYDYATLEVVKI